MAAAAVALEGTALLTEAGDPAAAMVAGIGAFLERHLALADAAVDSAPADEGGVAERRAALARRIGAVDGRLAAPSLELVGSTGDPSLVAAPPTHEVHRVRWPVLRGVDGEGLLLRPRAAPLARVVALPDADWTPEMLAGLEPGLPDAAQFARRLAACRCEVVIPALIDRDGRWAGGRPHREYVWRMAFEVGRHIIGYEVQKVLALVDLFAATDPESPVGVFGYGEGALIGLHAAALDPRIAAAAVSGHYRNRRRIWREPIYRDVWGLLRGFGDAELAALVAPRGLVVEAVPGPAVDGPRSGMDNPSPRTPGSLGPGPAAEVRAEVERARPAFLQRGARERLVLVEPGDGADRLPGPGTPEALRAFLALLGLPTALPPDVASAPAPPVPAPRDRSHRQFRQLCEHVQALIPLAEADRRAQWAEADRTSPAGWEASTAAPRRHFDEEVLGRCPDPSGPPRPRSRLAYDRPGWRGYEVALDVWPEVYCHGFLLLPKDLRPGERRPVVVCQHGLEGRAQEAVDGPPDSPYRRFAARLAERGFIAYAPQNPYIGGETFRVLQRKAHPLGWSLFSVIVAQHRRLLEWLGGLPWVDPDRIALYGLSYGGKTAMRVPAVLPGYALSICSANFNEWVRKCASEDRRFSYMYSGEYDMYEFDLAHTANYAEMAGLIAPRPFMVERGHRDDVAVPEWVDYEYAKVRRLYADLGIPDRTEIAYFDGGHVIDGGAAFRFLERHLGVPRSGERDG